MQKKIIEKLVERAEKTLPPEILEKIDQLDIHEITGSGYDEFGLNKEQLKIFVKASMFAYNSWFRAETFDIDRIPTKGPAIIVPNHSGQLPLDGMLIAVACVTQMENPRLPRAMVEKWFPTLPVVSLIFARAGQVPGFIENAEKLLSNEELLMIFPEGIRGSGKTWEKRYQLQRFTPGFLELSIRFNAPIIPTAVIGGEEQAPSFVDYKPLADLTGMPYFPITPTFPWFGPVGFLPYPSKYRIYFGEPIDFSEYKDDLPHPDKISGHIETVKNSIREMIKKGLAERPFPGL